MRTWMAFISSVQESSMRELTSRLTPDCSSLERLSISSIFFAASSMAYTGGGQHIIEKERERERERGGERGRERRGREGVYPHK